MQKKLLSVLILLSLVFVGCVKSYTYTSTNPSYTLEIPYSFEATDEIADPDGSKLQVIKSAENKPVIQIETDSLIKNLSYDEMITNEEARLEYICPEPDCAKVIDSQEEVINDKTFLKLVVEWKNSDQTTYYVFSAENKIVRIYTPKSTEGLKDIVETISFTK